MCGLAAGIGVEQLVDEGLVASPADLYTLTFEQIVGLEGFAELSTRNLLAAIADSRRSLRDIADLMQDSPALVLSVMREANRHALHAGGRVQWRLGAGY